MFFRILIFFASLTVVTGAVALHGQEVPQGLYTYRETVGEKSRLYSWKAVQVDGHVKISIIEKNTSFLTLCSTDGATVRWKMKDDGRQNITAERHGNTLHILGIHDGEPYEETLELDDRPWYQLLSFSLRDFLGSNLESITFWTIRTDDLGVILLKAEKKGQEGLIINDATIPALKVEVRAEGIFATFWHGTYWYRKRDTLFLRYRSMQGPPGTDETTVELLNIPDQP